MGIFGGGTISVFPGSLNSAYCLDEITVNSIPFQSKNVSVRVIDVRVTWLYANVTALGVSVFTLYAVQNGGPLSAGPCPHPDDCTSNREFMELSRSSKPSWLGKESGLCVRTLSHPSSAIYSLCDPGPVSQLAK